MSNTTQDDRYMSVIIDGWGYINRIRKIQPKQGPSYLACDVALKQSVGDKIDHVRFNCAIRGKKALEIIRQHFISPEGKVTCPEKTVITAHMTLGGITPEIFTYQKGDKKGQNGVALRSTLLGITSLKIGKHKVDLESDQSAANESPSQTQPVDNSEPAFVQELREEFGRNGCIRLSKDDPEFEERKAFLKAKGFIWDRQRGVWILPPKEEPTPVPAYEVNF